MGNLCKLCGGRKSEIGDKGCPHIGSRVKPKHRESLEHLYFVHNQQWRWERVDDEYGDIGYEVHGPRNSFIRFEGQNSKQDCMIFMHAVTKGK